MRISDWSSDVCSSDLTTIYLFGTIHVLKPGLSWFDEAVRSAFDASDELVMEIVQPDSPASVQALILTKGMSTDGPTLTERLPEDKRAEDRKSTRLNSSH